MLLSKQLSKPCLGGSVRPESSPNDRRSHTLFCSYEGLDNVLRAHLHSFFQDSGAIKSAGRVKRLGANSRGSFSVPGSTSNSLDARRSSRRSSEISMSQSKDVTGSTMGIEDTDDSGLTDLIGACASPVICRMYPL